jgi:hypothetical protein
MVGTFTPGGEKAMENNRIDVYDVWECVSHIFRMKYKSYIFHNLSRQILR